MTPVDVARQASAHLADLLGRESEGIVSLERADGSWHIGIEVVESRRIPETADILAEYDVEVDSNGDLIGYHRSRRYQRGRSQDVR